MYQGYPLDTGTSHFESFVAAHGGAIFDGDADSYIFESATRSWPRWSLFTRMLENDCAYLYRRALSKHGRFRHRPHALRRRQLGWHSLSSQGTLVTAEMTDKWVVTAFPGAEGVGATIQLYVPSQVILTGDAGSRTGHLALRQVPGGGRGAIGLVRRYRLLQHP